MLVDLLEQHASEAAFLWVLRDRAVRSPRYDLAALKELDERLDAHLQGLLHAGDDGWQQCRDALQWHEPGEVFTASVVAVQRRDLAALAELFDLIQDEALLQRAFIAAMAWSDFEELEPLLPALLHPNSPPALRHAGIAVCATHRRDPGGVVGNAIYDDQIPLRARALRAIGELGRTDLLRELKGALRSEDELCRFWAAWSAALFGQPEAVPVLQAMAEKGGPIAEAAVAMAVRSMPSRQADRWLRQLAQSATTARQAALGAGAAGAAGALQWLVPMMADRALARVAAAAFHLLTGVEISGPLTANPPEQGPDSSEEQLDLDDVELDPDDHYPWPEPVALQTVAVKHRARLDPNQRYLLGKGITENRLGHLLRRATQPVRAAAAIELALLTPELGLFETRAPGWKQRSLLNAASIIWGTDGG